MPTQSRVVFRSGLGLVRGIMSLSLGDQAAPLRLDGAVHNSSSSLVLTVRWQGRSCMRFFMPWDVGTNTVDLTETNMLKSTGTILYQVTKQNFGLPPPSTQLCRDSPMTMTLSCTTKPQPSRSLVSPPSSPSTSLSPLIDWGKGKTSHQ